MLENFKPLDENYSYLSVGSYYGEIKQRWVVIYSKALAQKKEKSLDKQANKELEKAGKILRKLEKKRFGCRADAKQALQQWSKILKFVKLKESFKIIEHKKYLKRGKPTEKTPYKIEYSLQAYLVLDKQYINEKRQKAGLFVLASNQLKEEILSEQQFLLTYKKQDGCEKGFRFLKDPQVMGSALFLKKNERIQALLTIMTLCLLVYACLEYKIRTALQKQEKGFFKDQKGKITKKPTTRWVFHCFQGIHLLVINQQKKLVINLNHIHRKLLDILGKQYWIYYS